MLTQVNTTKNKNKARVVVADEQPGGMSEIFAIGNMIYIETVWFENNSPVIASAMRDELGKLFVLLDGVLKEKTIKPVEPILNALRKLVANLHSGLLIEESDVVRLDKNIDRIEKLLTGSLL